jgi:hypothetical protein
LADSGAFVAGVLALLSQFHLNLALGAAIVALGLVGIDALIKRFERSTTVNAEEELVRQPVRRTIADQRPQPASRGRNPRQVHSGSNEKQVTQVKNDHSVNVRLGDEKFELRLSLRQRPLNISISESDSKGIVVEIHEKNQ